MVDEFTDETVLDVALETAELEGGFAPSGVVSLAVLLLVLISGPWVPSLPIPTVSLMIAVIGVFGLTLTASLIVPY